MRIWISILLFSFSHAAFANCNSPPQASGGRIGAAWWRQYSSWCTACGGTPYQDSSGGGCRPGSNWGGGSGGSSSGGGTGLNPTDQMVLDLFKAGMTELMRPPTPAEIEAKRQQDLLYQQQLQAAEAERLRLEKEKNDKLNADADSTLSLLASPSAAGAVSDDDLLSGIKSKFVPKQECVEGSKQHVCSVVTCGGGLNLPPVCCPEGYPLLNECDCRCYPRGAEFECKRYAACQYTYIPPKITPAK